MVQITKSCQMCGKGFHRQNKSTKFCSWKCYIDSRTQPVKERWTQAAVDHLRLRWPDGASHETIVQELSTLRSGPCITHRWDLADKAREIGLKPRRLDVDEREVEILRDLRATEKTDAEIAHLTGLKLQTLYYRTRKLMMLGLLEKRRSGRKERGFNGRAPKNIVIRSCGIYDDAGRCMQYIEGAEAALSEARVLAGRCRKRMTVWTMINDKGVDEKVAEVWPSGHMDMTFYGSALVGS